MAVGKCHRALPLSAREVLHRVATGRQITAGPGGHLAVVWSHGASGWHLHLYTEPAATPDAILPPTPPSNGNPPVVGAIAADGAIGLLPVRHDEVGLIEMRSGSILQRFRCGDVGRAAFEVGSDVVWIVALGTAPRTIA